MFKWNLNFEINLKLNAQESGFTKKIWDQTFRDKIATSAFAFNVLKQKKFCLWIANDFQLKPLWRFYKQNANEIKRISRHNSKQSRSECFRKLLALSFIEIYEHRRNDDFS